MVDDLEGRRTGERIQVLRERKGLSRPVLAGLVGKSSSWLKDIERGRRLPPRLPELVKLAEALSVGDVAALAGTDMQLTNGTAVPIVSFARIPHPAVPAIREAVRAPMIRPPDRSDDVQMLSERVGDAWRLWHSSPRHRDDVGRILPSLITDARSVARQADGSDRRVAHALLVDIYALAQHELVWASEPELMWTVADRGMSAAHEADQPLPLAGAAWTLAMVQRATGDTDGALSLVEDAAALLRPRLEDGTPILQSMYGALLLHAAATCARIGREGDALRYLDDGRSVTERLPTGYGHPWTQFGKSNVDIHEVSIRADLSKSVGARDRAQRIDPEQIASRERRARLLVEISRTYHVQRDYAAALSWLQRAYDVSRDSVHYSPGAREMVANIVDQNAPMTARESRTFAEKLGLPV